MKRFALVMLVVAVGLSLTGVVFAGDNGAIKTQHDEIVMAIDCRKMATDLAEAPNRKHH